MCMCMCMYVCVRVCVYEWDVKGLSNIKKYVTQSN